MGRSAFTLPAFILVPNLVLAKNACFANSRYVSRGCPIYSKHPRYRPRKSAAILRSLALDGIRFPGFFRACGEFMLVLLTLKPHPPRPRSTRGGSRDWLFGCSSACHHQLETHSWRGSANRLDWLSPESEQGHSYSSLCYEPTMFCCTKSDGSNTVFMNCCQPNTDPPVSCPCQHK